MNAPLFDDAAPGGAGAGVNGPSDAHNFTRLSLTPPARHNAPAGTSGVAADRITGHAKDLRARVLGLVVDSGRRRNTASGRPAAVWVTPNHAPKPEGGAA